MNTLSIRARVTVAFLLLIVMAGIETALVVYVQQASHGAFTESVRTEAILADQSALRAVLIGIQSAQRGYVIAMDPRELESREAQRAEYLRLVARIEPLIRDAEQRGQFSAIQGRVDEWEAISRDFIDRRTRGEDVAHIITEIAGPRFDVIRADLDVFERRQRGLTAAAIALGDANIQRATFLLTAIPVVAIVVIVGLLLATKRTILDPLSGVARTARRLAGGDYDAPLPPARGDEIGTLVDAFAEMRTAVQARAREAADANRQLKSAHAELMAIINAAPAGLVVIDPDGGIRLGNKAAEHLLGKVPDDPAARKAYWQSFTVRDTSGRDVRIRDLAPTRALGGTVVAGEELDIVRSDGRRADILIGAVPLRDADGRITGAVAGFQDITRLRELDRLKDEFVAIVSHELRTPLTAIRGSLQLLLADDVAADPEHRELLAVAASSCERLVRIVNDMLDLSKIEAGRLELRLASLSAETLAGGAADAVRPLAGQAGVRLQTKVDPGLPALRGDADRLTQALVNLLSNAIKFAPRDSTVTIGARLEGDAVSISVSDEGRGISPDQMPRLFQKFQQLDQPGTRRTGGTGLGLVITKGIIEQHGGRIAVDSAPGRGTKFTVTIPTDSAASAAAGRQVAQAAPKADQHTILIAEDDAETRTVLRKSLERHGFHVLEAADGAEALSIASRTPVDVLLLDLRMPRIHGHDVIRGLRQTPATAHLPIVVLSGSEGEQHSMQSLLLGANTFVVKPADPEALVREIERHIRNRPA